MGGVQGLRGRRAAHSPSQDVLDGAMRQDIPQASLTLTLTWGLTGDPALTWGGHPTSRAGALGPYFLNVSPASSLTAQPLERKSLHSFWEGDPWPQLQVPWAPFGLQGQAQEPQSRELPGDSNASSVRSPGLKLAFCLQPNSKAAAVNLHPAEDSFPEAGKACPVL